MNMKRNTKREHEETEKSHISFKEFNPENRNLRDHCHYNGYIEEQPTATVT